MVFERLTQQVEVAGAGITVAPALDAIGRLDRMAPVYRKVHIQDSAMLRPTTVFRESPAGAPRRPSPIAGSGGLSP